MQVLANYLAIGCIVTLGYLAQWTKTKPIYNDDFWTCVMFIFIWPLALAMSLFTFFRDRIPNFRSIFKDRSASRQRRHKELSSLIQVWLMHRDQMQELLGEKDPIEVQSKDLAETIMEQDTKSFDRWVSVTDGTSEREN